MAEKERPKRSLFSRLVFALVALIAAGALALACFAPVLNPAKLWFATLFGIAFLPLAIIAAILFLVALFRRSKMAFLLLLVLLPAFLLLPRMFKFKGPEETGQAPSARVLTYNVGLFANGKGLPSNRIAAADSVCAFLRSTGADVICIQEFYYPHTAPLSIDKYLRKAFPGYHAEYYALSGKYGLSGNVTLSRFPVKGKGKIDFSKSTNMALWTDIVFPGSTTLRVYNCHLQSYNISLKKVPQDGEAVEETERHVRRSLALRPEQVGLILESRKACPYKSLIAGDFNDIPLSYTYSRLLSGLKDSFTVAGKGHGATFTDLYPLLRIDYVLYPGDNFKAISHKVLKARYSDHYPVTTELVSIKK